MTSRVPAIFDAHDPCSPLCISNSETALLLMDYQNINTAAIGDEATKVVSVARTLQKWAVENQILVVHCLVQVEGQMPKPSQKMAGRFKIMQAKLEEMPALGDEDARLAMISPEEKTDARRPGFVSALQGPRLRELLDGAGVRSLILCGLSTSGCLLSTCRAATDVGYIVTVAQDACADTIPGLHDTLMKHVISSTAHVTTAAELKEVWNKEA